MDITGMCREIEKYDPEIVAVSYRLSPESAAGLFADFNENIIKAFKGRTFLLGTTKPVADAGSPARIPRGWTAAAAG